MVKNRKKHRQNSHLIIYCPTSEGVSERVSGASERASGPVLQFLLLAVIDHGAAKNHRLILYDSYQTFPPESMHWRERERERESSWVRWGIREISLRQAGGNDVADFRHRKRIALSRHDPRLVSLCPRVAIVLHSMPEESI